MMHPSDDDLRARFQRLKGDVDREGVPDFREMLARARAEAAPARDARDRRRWWIAGGWAATAGAAALAGILLTRSGSREDAEFERLVTAFASDASAGAWRSPTDALLEVPGSALMSSVPSLGDLPGLTLPALPDLDRSGDAR